jgi:transposase
MSEPGKTDLKPVPDPEVRDRPRRRRFTAKYKLKILRELDGCTEPGAVGAVLRREGLYSSHITTWRRNRAAGELQALAPRKRGRKPKRRNPLQPEVERLARENARLKEDLRKASLIIEVQKKISEMLSLPTDANGESVS